MARTPRRAGRKAAAGSVYLSQVAAQNVRSYRALRGLKQGDLAKLMSELEQPWTQATVSEIERNGRAVTVDELAGLAAALRVSVVAILDPRGPQRSRGLPIDVGGTSPIPVPYTHHFTTDPYLSEMRSKHIAMTVGLWRRLLELAGITPGEEPDEEVLLRARQLGLIDQDHDQEEADDDMTDDGGGDG